jgi:hypothetical protein
MSIRCSTVHYSSAEHDRLQTSAKIFSAVWPIGVPLTFGLMLFFAYRNARAPFLRRVTSPLSREYKESVYYWEVLELLKRLGLQAYVLGVPSSKSMMRIVIALLTCFMYMVLLFVKQPFRRGDDTVVAVTTNLMLVCTFLAAMLVKIFDDVSAKGQTQLAQEVLGFSSSFDASATLIVLAFAQLLLVVVVILNRLGKETKHARREQLLAKSRRLRYLNDSTEVFFHAPIIPEPWPKDFASTYELGKVSRRFHLFLSHVWGTGQDQMRVVKTRLKEM